MSQEDIFGYPTDWMLQMEMDAAHWQALIKRVDELVMQAIEELKRRDGSAAMNRLCEIKEGLILIKEISGLKHDN